MQRIHENLEYQSFPTPGGIVSAAVCSKSGKLPVPGLCDACVKSEIFEEGTVPTEFCDVHYAGTVCSYSLQPACDTCPFKAEGVFELPLLEDASLLSGSTTITGGTANTGQEIINEDGTVSTINICPHNAIFMADPNAEAIIAQQTAEMQMRAAVAAAALQQNEADAALAALQ